MTPKEVHKFAAARAKLLARRQALIVELREIDRMLGRPMISGPGGRPKRKPKEGTNTYQILEYIRTHEGCTASDIESALNIKRGYSASTLHSLDCRGLVIRRNDARPFQYVILDKEGLR